MIAKKRLPKFFIGVYFLTAVSIILYILFVNIPRFADWWSAYISPIGRFLLAKLTSWIPFSLTELLLILIPVWVAALIYIAARHYTQSFSAACTYVGMLVGGLCIILCIFVWNFASGYYGSSVDQKLSLDRREVTAEELYETSMLLSDELKTLSEGLVTTADGASVMPYSLDEMNEKLLVAYERLCEKHGFIQTYNSRVKPIMLSEPMSYTHITGIYTFFTGEANLNVNFPDYTLPFTAAHEMAHQRGISREDEANFIAFLVCMESDDPYIRYSGILNVYEYVANALYSADKTLYREVYATLTPEVREEQIAYSAFFDKYRENIAATVSQATNDAYLQSQGAKEGAKSYNMVVDLAVAYYRPQFE